MAFPDFPTGTVGRVRFESGDGVAIAECDYTGPMVSRPFVISFHGRWYEQNHQTSRFWAYREVGRAGTGAPSASSAPSADLPQDPNISNITFDVSDDAPVPEPEPVPAPEPAPEPPPPDPVPIDPLTP